MEKNNEIDLYLTIWTSFVTSFTVESNLFCKIMYTVLSQIIKYTTWPNNCEIIYYYSKVCQPSPVGIKLISRLKVLSLNLILIKWHITVYTLAHVYSCLQNGDVLLILSCCNWYDNKQKFLLNNCDKFSIFPAVNRIVSISRIV